MGPCFTYQTSDSGLDSRSGDVARWQCGGLALGAWDLRRAALVTWGIWLSVPADCRFVKVWGQIVSPPAPAVYLERLVVFPRRLIGFSLTLIRRLLHAALHVSSCPG